MLILVRHGQSESNAAGLLVGRSDPPLTELGRSQAELTGRMLAGERSAAGRTGEALTFVTSPLSRAMATTEILVKEAGYDGRIAVEQRIIELDYGDFDGQRLSELDPAEVAAWRRDPSWRPPRGETLLEVQERVEEWCRSIADLAASGDVVAVTHVSPVKAAAAWAMGVGPEVSWRMSLSVAAVTRVATSPGPSLVSFGETGHLAPLR